MSNTSQGNLEDDDVKKLKVNYKANCCMPVSTQASLKNLDSINSNRPEDPDKAGVANSTPNSESRNGGVSTFPRFTPSFINTSSSV